MAMEWAKDVTNNGSYNQVEEKKVKPQHEQGLNCPRCNSTNTKFCYYNNYSLTQPRYFCKACKRYWTKGGSLRSVPVGGGSRKNKRSITMMPKPIDLSHFSSSQTPHEQDYNLGFLKLPKIENSNDSSFLSSSLTRSGCEGLNPFSTRDSGSMLNATRFSVQGFPFQEDGERMFGVLNQQQYSSSSWNHESLGGGCYN